jgi:hypothetical protein
MCLVKSFYMYKSSIGVLFIIVITQRQVYIATHYGALALFMNLSCVNADYSGRAV